MCLYTVQYMLSKLRISHIQVKNGSRTNSCSWWENQKIPTNWFLSIIGNLNTIEWDEEKLAINVCKYTTVHWIDVKGYRKEEIANLLIGIWWMNGPVKRVLSCSWWWVNVFRTWHILIHTHTVGERYRIEIRLYYVNRIEMEFFNMLEI